MATELEIHGGFNNTGNFNNVVLCGAPSSTGFGGVPLSTAHASGVGRGLTFDGSRSNFRLGLNLVGIATNDSGAYVPNQRYVHYGGTYDWFIDIHYSTNNGASWVGMINHEKIFIHDASQDWDLCYRSTWLRTAQNSQWSRNGLSVPANTTHLRISISGEEPTQSTWVVYTFSQLIPTYKPMAIRKSGSWQTLNRTSGFIRRRIGGTWVDRSNEQNDTAGSNNVGHNRVRKSGTWKQQRIKL